MPPCFHYALNTFCILPLPHLQIRAFSSLSSKYSSYSTISLSLRFELCVQRKKKLESETAECVHEKLQSYNEVSSLAEMEKYRIGVEKISVF